MLGIIEFELMLKRVESKFKIASVPSVCAPAVSSTTSREYVQPILRVPVAGDKDKEAAFAVLGSTKNKKLKAKSKIKHFFIAHSIPDYLWFPIYPWRHLFPPG